MFILETRVQEMLEKFDANIQTKTQPPMSMAIDLVCNFVTIHPFINGNGRMSRLLFSYALERLGYPFSVTLDSGYSRAYKHYIQALRYEQLQGPVAVRHYIGQS